MIHIGDDAIVLLDCAEELAASYQHHRPIAGQFTVAHPYQEAAPALDSNSIRDTEGICEDRQGYEPRPRSRCAAAFQIPAAAAEDAPQSSPHDPDAALSQQKDFAVCKEQPSQRRKRKRKQHIYQPNAQVATMALAT